MSVVNCPRCQAPVFGRAPNAPCPACLMQLALPASDADVDLYGPTELQAGSERIVPAQILSNFPELEILGLVGQGGMGAVYKARQRDLDRLVALKLIKPEAADVPGFAERFTSEARILARLNHPHIVAVHDFGNRDGLYYLVMEYVDGVNLRELLQASKVPVADALEIVMRLCEALQFAHDEGVIHRDIKPENILLDRKGRIKIADFGLAKVAGDQPPDLALTGSRQIVGTPNYMAPEQRQGARKVDHRADLYALGVVFYEMLTGELPLGRFEPPSHKVACDARLDRVVLRSLEQTPARRYQQASEIRTDVETIAQTVLSAQRRASRSGAKPSLREDLHRWSNFTWVLTAPRNVPRKWWLALGATLAILLCVYLAALTTYAQHRLAGAAEEGHLGLVSVYLAIGVSPDAQDAHGETALLKAAGRGQTAVVEKLLAWGAQPDAANANGITPLMYAAWQGEDAVVTQLLSGSRADPHKRSNDGETALHKAAFQGHTTVVKKLLRAGVILDEVDADGETALILGAAQGHLPIVKLLLEHGANAKTGTRAGLTPLMVAARGGYLPVVEILLPVSRVSATAGDGATALSLALTSGNPEVIEQILSSGAEETGTLHLWRGVRLVKSGQPAAALASLSQAALKSGADGQSWSFKTHDVLYTVPVPACANWLILGATLKQSGKPAEAAEAFRKALNNMPASWRRLVLVRASLQSPGRTEIQEILVTREEIQRHISDPSTNWNVGVDREVHESRGVRESHSTAHSQRELGSFFE